MTGLRDWCNIGYGDKAMNLLTRLKNEYGYDYPIFLSEIDFGGLSKSYVGSQISRLVKSGEIIRFSRGVYYIPQETRFGKSVLQPLLVCRRKFIRNKGKVFGFYSGLNLENGLGLSTQVPGTTEITTNAAKRNSVLKVGFYRIALKKPRVRINNRNVSLLQFLNVIERIELASFGQDDFDILSAFIKKNRLKRKSVLRVAEYYPKKTLETLRQTRLINELA